MHHYPGQQSDHNALVKRGKVQNMDSIEIIGPFDSIDEQVDELAKRIFDDGKVDIVFDLKGTSYLTSSGIATLIKILKHVQQAGGTLAITGATDDMMDLVRLARLDKYIRFI